MRVLIDPTTKSSNFSKIMKNQSIAYNNTIYRLLLYIHIREIDDEVILYNIMTGVGISISREEYDSILNNTLKEKNIFLYIYLIRNWFLVPEDFNEKTMIDIMRNMYSESLKLLSFNELHHFVIFTTTDCNARCYYCFEHGCSKQTMDIKTAEDVSRFIIERYNNTKREVFISWFGGEPTINMNAIHVISDKLNAANVKFKSVITSNGYLLNKENIEYLVNDSHLYRVQITLDGAKDKYNKTKNYIYKNDSNLFETVITNIKLLLNYDIRVVIRLNLTSDNLNDLLELIDYISDSITPNDKIKGKLDIYTHGIFEGCTVPTGNSLEDIDKVHMDKLILKNKIFEKSLDDTNCINFTMGSTNGVILSPCMVNGDKSVVIYPDGSLGKCEHFVDTNQFGSIYSHYLDIEYEELFNYIPHKELNEECYKCKFYPKCITSNICNGAEVCTPAYIVDLDNELDFVLKNKYNSIDKNHYNAKVNFNCTTDVVYNGDLSKLEIINIDSREYYILHRLTLLNSDYMMIIPVSCKNVSEIEIYKYIITESEITLNNISSLEELIVLYDCFNKIVDSTIINRILRDNSKGDDKNVI